VSIQLSFARRRTGGAREVRKRGKSNFMEGPDARLEHPAAPHRYLRPLGYIVDRNCFTEAAYTSDLDVDDAAGAQLGRGLSVAAPVYRFIQADRCLQLLL